MADNFKQLYELVERHTTLLEKLTWQQAADSYLLDRLLEALVDKNILTTEELLIFARRAESFPNKDFINEIVARLRRA